jgi:aminoglycoside 3-N-acetyltransferase I
MHIHHLAPGDDALFDGLLTMFGEAFEDVPTYADARPGEAYRRELLGDPNFIALAGARDGAVIGGLAAYVLRKFEREFSEVYIYDLAVDAAHRRQGVAMALIEALKPIARARGAYVIFVQAAYGHFGRRALHQAGDARERDALRHRGDLRRGRVSRAWY